MAATQRGSWSGPIADPVERARPRPVRAVLLSALLPGAGQLTAGRRRRGWWMIATVLLIGGTAVGLVVALVAAGADQAVDVLARRETLAVVVAANLVVGGLRFGSAADAWYVARGPGRTGLPAAAAVIAVLVVLVVVPHVGIGVAAVGAQRVVDAVLVAPASGEASGGVATSPVSPSPDAGRQAESSATPAQGPDEPAPVSDGDDFDALVPDGAGAGVGAPLLDGADRFTMLLLGSDAGPGRTGTRVDVMVVASMDINSGAISLISVPRNLAEVPMPAGALQARLGARYPARLMSLYPEAAADPVLADIYEDPGRAAVAGAVSALLNLPIDHVAMVDMGGFVDVVDALGGVDVDVDRPIRVRLSPAFEEDDPRTFDIAAGPQTLDGQQALAYVRTREGSDDYDRMRRQRCLAGSIAADTDPLGLLRATPRLADVVAERVRTDVPTDMLPDIARLAFRADLGALRTLGITPPTYTAGRNDRGHLTPDLERIRGDVADLLRSEPPPDAGDLEATCG